MHIFQKDGRAGRMSLRDRRLNGNTHSTMTTGNSNPNSAPRGARVQWSGYGRRRRAVNAVPLLLIALILATPAEAATRLVMLGDSLVAGYGLPNSKSFPAALSRALTARGLDVEVRNAGVSGETSAGLRARLGWALSEPTDAAIVVIGGNDALRALDPGQMRANIGAVLDGLRVRGIPVLLAGMLAPPNLGRGYRDAFNSAFADLGKTKATVFYPFFLDGVAALPELNQADGIHPNEEGVDEIVRRILPDVERLLARAGGG